MKQCKEMKNIHKILVQNVKKMDNWWALCLQYIGHIIPKDYLDYDPSTQDFYEDSRLLECCVVLTTNRCW